MVAATLDGVLHLAHQGLSNPLVLTETFSLSGLLTPLKPISYDQKLDKSTNSGYGTVAQAGGSSQRPIHGVLQRPGGAMAMATRQGQVLLLFQSDEDQQMRMCVGRYTTEGGVEGAGR